MPLLDDDVPSSNLVGHSLPDPEWTMSATANFGIQWVKDPTGSRATVLFVHGILSDGVNAWTHQNGANWPNMLGQDILDVRIGVFCYRADALARTYGPSDAADYLREYFELEGLWNRPRLVFVCHSLGGIVTRRFIIANQNRFPTWATQMGLFLVASPSLGSADANRIQMLARMLRSTQAQALRMSQENVWLNDLDKDFWNLKETSGLSIRGKELQEDEPISKRTLIGWLRSLVGLKEQVVTPHSAHRYFPLPIKIAGSDHLSISKPESREAFQHRLLVRFVREIIDSSPATRPPVKPESDHAASALRVLKERLQAGKLVEYEALAAVQDALLETRAYLVRRAAGEERDDDTERILSELWSKAGMAIAPYDAELSGLCYVKGNGWADSDLWEKPGVKELPISVDEMLQRILESTRKASGSARRMDGPSGTNVVEGTLKVDTLTWRTTVLLPPFAMPPHITVARRDGRASAEPVVEGVTPDKFTVRISSSDQAGEWVWRARGNLISPPSTQVDT